MKHYPSLTKTVFVLASAVVIIGFSAFGQRNKNGEDSFRKELLSKDEDTTKHKLDGNETIGFSDKIEEQMKQLEVQMKVLNEQMKNLDMNRYQKEIDNAIRNIDVDKINEQVEESMKNIDLEKINNELAENEANLSSIKTNELKKQMEQLKSNLREQKYKIEIDRQKMKTDIERAMKNARHSLENAKEEIRNIKEFTDVLEKDGLIDKSKAYKIEVKDGELYIDGKKQTKETSDKYRKYYKKSNFTINMSAGDDFWI